MQPTHQVRSGARLTRHRYAVQHLAVSDAPADHRLPDSASEARASDRASQVTWALAGRLPDGDVAFEPSREIRQGDLARGEVQHPRRAVYGRHSVRGLPVGAHLNDS
jgi:hypothetical protein